MYQVGSTVRDFTLDSTEGKFVLSERVKKGPVLLYFYVVNYGQTCTNYMEDMNEGFDDFTKRNISLIHVNPSSVEEHRGWIKHTDSLYEHICDENQIISKEFDCIITKAKNEKIIGKTNRAFFLIDENMKIKYLWKADLPTDTVLISQLLAEIDSVLNQNN